MALGIILGTRPEIIKMAPIIRLCRKQSIPHYLLHTGQHYSYRMDQTFFQDLELPQPHQNLNVGSGTHAQQTGKIMTGVEKTLQKEETDVVFVQGDTNTVLAGALAASKLHIPVGHVEAGLRSFDCTMPEEINRIVTDHVSNLLFAPTETAKQNLLNEGINSEKIHITGNTVVDAVYQNKDIAEKKRNPLKKHGLEPNEYFLVTAHRAENTDNPERLKGILKGLEGVSEKHGLPMIYPIHPRTRKMMNQYGYKTNRVTLIDPVGYLGFLVLESKARLILTDSGGVQEEACILGVPCVTLRYNTERPETLHIGANTLAGTDPQSILNSVKKMLDAPRGWGNPYGDGKAAQRILEITLDYLNR